MEKNCLKGSFEDKSCLDSEKAMVKQIQFPFAFVHLHLLRKIDLE